ncbi:hypothetical protein CONLIGDRAFT_694302 [Coniochaeta ligniaria NRRL 30616]|uniref:DUF7923 domain-containing protein n=1 Tax=Coniochaeta ligniaria NRRL 30616 TaxID=1408157 RepID=A0A1J7I693_9PEZI|nr:hypothetical protein CONLIGDRAFT_694302 [Coniochaeta ligniaria NRRL 30616]
MADDPKPPVDRLKHLWGQVKTHEDQMQSCVTDIIARNETLERKLAEAESELMDKRDAIRTLRLDLHRIRHDAPEVTTRTSDSDQELYSAPARQFDSDFIFQFKRHLISQSQPGGSNAATMLRDAVQEEVKGTLPTSSNPMSLLIRIFGNTSNKSMSKIYPDDPPRFQEFVRGFNTSVDECYYVDMGVNGSERVRVTFRDFLAYNRCKKIFFGFPHNEEYSELLDGVAQDKTGKVTLISGRPWYGPFSTLSTVVNKLGSVPVKALFDTVLPHSIVSRKRKAVYDLPQPTGPPQPTGVLQPTGPPQPAGFLQPTGPPQPAGFLQPTGPPQPAGFLQPTGSPQPAGFLQSTGPPQPPGFLQSAGPPQTADHLRPSMLVQPFGTPTLGITQPSVLAPQGMFNGSAPAPGSGIFGSLTQPKASALTTPQGSAQVTPFKNPVHSIFPPKTYDELVTGGYCVTYHILGRCAFAFGAFGKCDAIHGLRLDPAGIEKVASEARQIQCMKGVMCNLKDCIYGHPHLEGGDSKAGIKPSGT